MVNYSNLTSSMNLIRSQANELAKGAKIILDLKETEKFLETIYIPFLCHSMVWRELGRLKQIYGNPIPRDFNDLYNLMMGAECQSDQKLFSTNIEGEAAGFDFIAHTKLNIYEKIVFLVNGISYTELRDVETREEIKIIQDIESRARLKESLIISACAVAELIDILPLTLFEGLKVQTISEQLPTAKCHWLGQIHNENYLFYLAREKERGALVIGQPHGGAYCQLRDVMGNEMAEMILSDAYHIPIWEKGFQAFPNWRASRNMFLQLKSAARKRKKKKKMLVILSYFHINDEPPTSKMFVDDRSLNDFYYTQLHCLSDHFKASYDFKIYPRQEEVFLPKLDFLKQIYPGSEFIDGGSVLDCARHYDGVIHMDIWGTSVIELATSKIKQYVYLGPELTLNKEYETFVWNESHARTRDNYSDGAYLLINNLSYRKAYGASFVYPFYFSKLIKTLIATFDQDRSPRVLNVDTSI